MRLSGFITHNGEKIWIDWTVLSDRIVSGPGADGSAIKVHVPPPEFSSNVQTTVQPAGTDSVIAIGYGDEDADVTPYVDGYEDHTVTELRVFLQQRSEPIYGNKAQLIERLRAWDAANPEGLTTEEEEEDTEEVTESDDDS
jgi:hypothetical protein